MATAKELANKTASTFETDPKTKPIPRGSLSSRQIKDELQYNVNRSSGPEGLVESPFADDFFNTKILGIDFGSVDESAYNRKGFNDPFNSAIDFEKIRADKQSAFATAGALATQFFGKTVMGAVGNVLGTFYGLSQIPEHGSQALFDNKLLRSVDEVNESIEAKNTAFVNNKDGLSFNAKTAKELTDAFSFIASAALAEGIMMSIGNVVGAAGLTTLPARLTRYASKIKSLMNFTKEGAKLERAAARLGTTVDDLSRYRRNIDAFIKSPTQAARRLLTTTGYEAGLEARGARDEFINKMEAELQYKIDTDPDLTQEEIDVYKAKIQQDSEKVAMSTWIANTALLSVSNAIQFPSIFGNSFKTSRGIHKLESAGLNKVIKSASKGQRIATAANTVGRILKSPVTEFFEETGQGLANATSQNYYETILGDQTQKGALTDTANHIGNSLWEGLKETYGTDEGRHEGYIGAIVGLVGLPGLKRRANGKRGLTMHGGLAEGVRGIRRKREYTNDAINVLNDATVSDVLKMNTNDAVRSSVDKQAQDLAIIQNDPIAFEQVENNKIFRYVKNRVSRGLDSFIADDIAELRQMDIDTYRQTFDKGENFNEKQKSAEIDKFENKAQIYEDAYKAVHQRFNSKLLRSTDVTSKLGDVLTHAIATEKLSGDRLNLLKNRWYQMNTKFTPEELDQFVDTAEKVQRTSAILQDYINSKSTWKPSKQNLVFEEKRKLKDQLDPVYSHMLDLDIENLQRQKEILEKEEDKGEYLNTQLKNVNKALSLKEKYDGLDRKFDANKSSVVRKYKKDIETTVAQVNKEIADSTSKSMEAIGAYKEKLTVAELESYFEKKKDIVKDTNKKIGSTSVYERLDEDEITGVNIFDEITRLTKNNKEAVKVAEHLYGFRKNPEVAYSKIVLGELHANLENAHRQAQMLHFLDSTKAGPKEIERVLEELKMSREVIEANYLVMATVLPQEAKEFVDEQLEHIDSTIEQFDRKGTKDVAVDTQLKDAQKVVEEEQEAVSTTSTISTDELDFGDLDAHTKKGSTDQQATEANTFDYESYTLQEKGKFHEKLGKLIEEGEIQVDAPVTLKVLESQLDPDENMELKASLAKLAGSYKKGLEKIKNNKSVLYKRDLDPDVYTVVRYMPVSLDIGDTWNEFMQPADDVLNDKTAQESPNSYGNYSFRLKLAQNHFIKDTNLVDLKVHDVKMGEMQKPAVGTVEEKSVYDLRQFDSAMTIDDIYYTDKDSEYRRIDGEFPEDIPGSPAVNWQPAKVNGAIFFVYKDKAGRRVPIKMNTKKLGLLFDEEFVKETNHVDNIINTLEEYYKVDDKSEYRTKNQPISFLNGLDINQYMSFFLKTFRNKFSDVIFLSNTYSVHKEKKSGNHVFTVFTGDVKAVQVSNLKDLQENKEALKEALRKSRFNINKDHILKKDAEGKNIINKQVVEYLFDNKIINHAFDTNNNFDKIYTPSKNKGVTLRYPDAEKIKKEVHPPNFGNMIRELRNSLGEVKSVEDDYEPNLISINRRLDHDTYKLAVKLIKKDKLSHKDAFEKAIKDTVQTQVNKIQAVADKFPLFAEDGKILSKFENVIRRFETEALKSDELLGRIMKIRIVDAPIQDKTIKKTSKTKFFTTNVIEGYGLELYKFNNVESAFQAMKIIYGEKAYSDPAGLSNKAISLLEDFESTTEEQAKTKGKTISMTKDEIVKWNKDSSDIRKILIKEFLEQNPVKNELPDDAQLERDILGIAATLDDNGNPITDISEEELVKKIHKIIRNKYPTSQILIKPKGKKLDYLKSLFGNDYTLNKSFKLFSEQEKTELKKLTSSTVNKKNLPETTRAEEIIDVSEYKSSSYKDILLPIIGVKDSVFQLFKEQGLPKEFIKSTKEALTAAGIEDINKFAMIIKAYKSAGEILTDSDYSTFAERLFKGEYPKDC